MSRTFCGARFSVCKELLHIFTNTVDGVKPANSLLRCATRWTTMVVNEQKKLDSETACFYYAIEVMLPWILRNTQFNELHERFKDDGDCNLKMARAFMIPEKVINHICEIPDGKGLPYCGFSYSLNVEISEANG